MSPFGLHVLRGGGKELAQLITSWVLLGVLGLTA